MKIIYLVIALSFIVSPLFAEDEKTQLQLVEYMLKVPLDQADPKLVSPFMQINADTLPKKWRDKARAKQLQIDAIVKIHQGKKKGPFRFPDPKCTPKRYGPEGIKIMNMIPGNFEIRQEEEEYIELKTNCTEEQLLCEFSMNVVVIPRPGKPSLRHYFLIESDPLMAIAAEKRGGGGSASRGRSGR